MRWWFPLVALVFVAVSCDQQPVEPAADPVAEAPALNFINGPAEPGNSFIIRDEFGDFFWTALDEKTGLLAIVTDDDTACIDFDNATLVPFQQIFNPSGEGLVMYFENGWLNAAVFAPPYECGDRLATGMVHNQWQDNDIDSFLYEHNRANAYGGHFNGRVGDYSVFWKVRCVWGGPTKEDFNNPHCNFSQHVK